MFKCDGSFAPGGNPPMGDNFSWVPYVVAAAVCVVVIAGLLIYTKIKASKDNKNGGSNDGNDNKE